MTMIPDLWPHRIRFPALRQALSLLEMGCFAAGLLASLFGRNSPPLAVAGSFAVVLLLGMQLLKLFAARRALRHTTLVPAHAWAVVALLVWLAGFFIDGDAPAAPLALCRSALRYLSVVLVVAGFVAVLGARRPGM